MNKRWRAMRMGLETVLGLRRRGFFIPYRYAEQVRAPGPYPAMERAFRAAETTFDAVLDLIDGHAERLAAFAGPPPEPRWDQNWFPRADGAAAYALVHARRPSRIVEVGSGHSTRFLARAARDSGAPARIICIDPAPRADIGPLEVDWRREVLSEAHVPLFAELEEGDVAFFDSSHILMPGTDVDMIFSRILPALRKGVLVHVHDVLLPDPYPAHWAWRGYSEQNGLTGWVLGGAFRPVFASAYAVSRMGAAARPGLAALPLPDGALETSFWMERA